MKKLIRAAALLLSVATVFLCSCSSDEASERVYNYGDEFSITMDSGFSEMESEVFTYALESSDSMLLVLKEDFDKIEEAGYKPDSMTLADYAGIVAGNSERHIFEENGLVYFMFEASSDSRSFFYLASVYKGENAFWLCQFVCLSGQASRLSPVFMKWASSVEIHRLSDDGI